MDTVSKIENLRIQYNGNAVSAKKLTVSSQLPINIETAWTKVQTPKLLKFITKGKVRLEPINDSFSNFCKEGQTIEASMFVYGFIPFGGAHTLYFSKVDSINHILQTEEKNSVTKVWNHKITMTKIGDSQIEYEDEIIIYAGVLTSIIAWWAKSFYNHRQRRWLLIADKHRWNDRKNK